MGSASFLVRAAIRCSVSGVKPALQRGGGDSRQDGWRKQGLKAWPAAQDKG